MHKRKDYSLFGHAGSPAYSQSVLSTSSTLAWLYVSALCLSYCVCATILHKAAPVDAKLWAAFTAQVPLGVFQWQLAAFGGVLLLNIINLVFCSTPVQYNCNVLLVLIHTVAFATDYLIEAQATSLVVSWGGRMFLPLRYVQWCHTTPSMILLMSMMTDLPSWRVYAAVAADLVMVITGLAASWTAGPLQYINLVLSVTGFVVVVSAIVDMFKGAMAEASADATSRLLLGRMLRLTLLVWSLFPVVWLAAHCGVLSMTVEQVLWGVSDYGAKVVFSSHLWQKNLATVQQRREAAQELMGALDRGLLLERVRGLAASKERLMYALSHELRAPINGMLALVQELLHNKTQSAASRTKMLMMIRSSATCLLNTIDTTLNGSGAGLNGQVQRRSHKVHMWRVCESVLRLTRPMVREHVRLINCISKDMPPVKGDSTRLMQVLMNLVCTCLKFTHAGDIKVSASQTHSAASVVVADTGQGIPPEQLAQALHPFEQDGEAADVWDVCRSGLGLYLVQQALNSMGSSIQASSELGRGSTFRFELPLADSECESESEMETDLFSEAGSLRASLELQSGDYDSALGCRGVMSSDSQSVMQSKCGSTDLLQTPAAATAGPRANYLSSSSAAGTGSSTAASSIVSGLDHEGVVAVGSAAAAADGVAANSTTSSKPNPLLQPPSRGTTSSKLVPSGSSSPTALGLLPAKQCHRNMRDGKIQVLSVDDDPVNQLVASAALRSHKWDVVKCMSGSEAIDYLERSCSVLPDLVLLDVMMPSMSGFEVASRLRQNYPSSLLPIIMVSAKTEEDDIVQGLRCGADDYITKPFKHAELAARIRAHIRARDAFAQQQAAEQAWLLQHNLLPPNVQRKLRAGETVIAESHACATVLWAEVVGGLADNGVTAQHAQQFASAAAAAAAADRITSNSGSNNIGAATGADATHHQKQQQQQQGSSSAAADADSDVEDTAVISRRGSGGLSPAEAVVTLNSLYTTWEELCAQRDVLGVDFSGSTFVAVSGHDDNPQHMRLMLSTAEAMLGVAAAMAAQHQGSSLAVRLGLHTGPITTGLVGSKAVKLVLMGNTVEAARQLASSGCSSGLHLSADVYNALGGSTGVAAAAMPWTLQTLPGSDGRQHTYLLPSAAGAAATGSNSNAEQQAQPAAAAAALEHGKVQQLPEYLVPTATAAAASSAAGAKADGSTVSLMSRTTPPAAAAAAVATSADAGVSSSSNSGSLPCNPGAVHEVSVGRLARFLRPGAAGKAAAAAAAAAATAAVYSSSDLAKDAEQAAQGLGSQLHTPAAPDVVAATSLMRDNHITTQPGTAAAALHAGSSSSGSSRPSVMAVVTTALPAPAPGGSVGFGSVGRSSRDSKLASTSPLPAVGVSGTSLAAAAADAGGVKHLAAEDEAECWPQTGSLIESGANMQQQQQEQAALMPRSSNAQQAAAAAVTAAVAAQTADIVCITHVSDRESSLQNVHTASVTSTHEQHSIRGEQREWQQQLQAGSAALLMQLGEERQKLHAQLLESTKQYAAASAELACVKQQLADAQTHNAHQAAMVDSLRQQLGSAVVKAHLADCWRALATVKVQFNSLMATGTAPQQQQQQQLLLQQLAALSSAGLPAAAAAVPTAAQQQLSLVGAGAMPEMAAAAAAGDSAVSTIPVNGVASTMQLIDSDNQAARNATSSTADAAPAAVPSLQQLIAAHTAQLNVLQQQQQLMALAALQQQQQPAGHLLAQQQQVLQQLQQVAGGPSPAMTIPLPAAAGPPPAASVPTPAAASTSRESSPRQS